MNQTNTAHQDAQQPVAPEPGVAGLGKREDGVQEEAQQGTRAEETSQACVDLHKSHGQQEDQAGARARPAVLKTEACEN